MPRSAEPQPVEHEKPLGRHAEKHRADGVRDAADDDVDGCFDLGALRRSQRQVEKLVGGLVEREPQSLIERVGHEDRRERRQQQDRAALPVPSAAGSTQDRDGQAESPKRRTDQQPTAARSSPPQAQN